MEGGGKACIAAVPARVADAWSLTLKSDPLPSWCPFCILSFLLLLLSVMCLSRLCHDHDDGDDGRRGGLQAMQALPSYKRTFHVWGLLQGVPSSNTAGHVGDENGRWLMADD